MTGRQAALFVMAPLTIEQLGPESWRAHAGGAAMPTYGRTRAEAVEANRRQIAELNGLSVEHVEVVE